MARSSHKQAAIQHPQPAQPAAAPATPAAVGNQEPEVAISAGWKVAFGLWLTMLSGLALFEVGAFVWKVIQGMLS